MINMLVRHNNIPDIFPIGACALKTRKERVASPAVHQQILAVIFDKETGVVAFRNQGISRAKHCKFHLFSISLFLTAFYLAAAFILPPLLFYCRFYLSAALFYCRFYLSAALFYCRFYLSGALFYCRFYLSAAFILLPLLSYCTVKILMFYLS